MSPKDGLIRFVGLQNTACEGAEQHGSSGCGWGSVIMRQKTATQHTS